MPDKTQLHATCVALAGKGVLLLGDSGSGKSDLALRLIDSGAKLVADDRVDIAKVGRRLAASAPKALHGRIEARGVGILSLPCMASVGLHLAVRLVPRGEVERLPEPQFFSCLGVKLPLLLLHAFDASTVAKIRVYVGMRA